MEKLSQGEETKQRNGWVRGMNNKWNRCVDEYAPGTPWRISRDAIYDFTHNAIDAIKFDEDPSRIYSGEALWRMYIMDKFSSDFKDKDGHLVGGYINSRFHVYPTAGTPSNPDAPRDGGNQMELGLEERTRKPRPHQYSTERRLQEARGNKLEDIEVTSASVNKLQKLSITLPEERNEDSVYNIMRDTIDMREAGISYDDILTKVSSHYGTSILNVAQIDQFAQKMVKKHNGIAYEIQKCAFTTPRSTLVTQQDLPIVMVDTNEGKNLQSGTNVVVVSDGVDNGKPLYQIVSGVSAGSQFFIPDSVPQETLQSAFVKVDPEGNAIQDAADEVGLNDETEPPVDAGMNLNDQTNPDFSVDEV